MSTHRGLVGPAPIDTAPIDTSPIGLPSYADAEVVIAAPASGPGNWAGAASVVLHDGVFCSPTASGGRWTPAEELAWWWLARSTGCGSTASAS